ncbi:MAG TPA: hypothetical protein VK699_14735 [Terriglobales bacterium]|jgi:DNA-directed RNA polymerase specialized sigma24 family protein|nr:hypothetical protein [Terriglobales bacterium]
MNQASVQPAMKSLEDELERLTNSAYLLTLDEEMSSNSILLLDPGPRIAFLLHHVLCYEIEEVALLLDMTEKEFRAELRSAYLQLSSAQIGPGVYLEEPAVA